MEIRPLQASDGDAFLGLSEYAFQYEMEPTDRRKWVDGFKPSGELGCFVEGRLAAALHLPMFDVWLNGSKHRACGVAGVAVWPEFRRLGLARALIHAALASMKEQGIAVSMLHPFNISFYRKLGWELFQEHKELTVAADQLPRWAAGAGTVRPIARPEEVYPVYEAFASRYNGMLSRTPSWWESRVLGKKGRIVVFETAAGTATGYLYYQLAGRVFTVHELIALDDQARRSIWKFIADHDSMIDKAVVRLPADDPTGFMLGNMQLQQKRMPYGMARIVDAQAFVARYAFVPGQACTVRLRIRDDQAAWNEGAFDLSIRPDGSAEMVRTPSEARDDPCLRCSIGTLSAMMAGFMRPETMASIGELTGCPVQLASLGKALPQATTYVIDAF